MDHPTGRSTSTCQSCDLTWVITRRALRAHAAACRPVPAPTLDRPFEPIPEFDSLSLRPAHAVPAPSP